MRLPRFGVQLAEQSVCIAFLLAFATASHAAPVFYPGTGHFYELVEAGGVSWNSAAAAADSRVFAETHGTLATVTSAFEDNFLLNTFGEHLVQKWIGGFQFSSSGPSDGWQWITGEQWSYTNWAPNEPNDFNGVSENALHYKWTDTGAPLGTWNDLDSGSSEFNGRTMNGYIVEYDVKCPDQGLTLAHVPSQDFQLGELKPEMQIAVANFQSALLQRTGQAFTPTSGYRTAELQAHFVDIRDTYKRLANVSGISKTVNASGQPQLMGSDSPLALACQQCIQAVNPENADHELVANSKMNPAVNDISTHPNRLGVDFSYSRLTQFLGIDEIRQIARENDLNWLYPSDRVHFEYDGELNNGNFDHQLDGWNVLGPGTALAVENEAVEDDYHVELTAGSPVQISERLNIPDSTNRLRFEAAFLSGAGDLEVFLDDISLLVLNGVNPESALSTYQIKLPRSVVGMRRELRFVFDGPAGAKLLMDNVALLIPIPGDYNDDGTVDAADYTIWRDNLGSDFDLNGNGTEEGDSAGIVDQADYELWKSQVIGAGSASLILQVPEPVSSLLAALVGFGIFVVRRR